MRLNQKLAVVMGASFALVNLAVGQPVTQNDISGNECWNVGQGPGGPGGFLCINLVRNGRALRLVSGVTATVATTTTSADGTIFWTGTAPTTWSITLSAIPFNGEVVYVTTDTTLTTIVTVLAGTGTTLNAAFNAQTLSAGSPIGFQYNKATAKWYRVN